jgi:hypothetical protein
MEPAEPIRVNRAPVLTLWAAIVAERLGHPRDTALTLGRAVAGSAARVKARNIGREERRSDRDADTSRLADVHVTAPVLLLGKQSDFCRPRMVSYARQTLTNPLTTPRLNAIWRKRSVTGWAKSGLRWSNWRRRCHRTS